MSFALLLYRIHFLLKKNIKNLLPIVKPINANVKLLVTPQTHQNLENFKIAGKIMHFCSNSIKVYIFHAAYFLF